MLTSVPVRVGGPALAQRPVAAGLGAVDRRRRLALVRQRLLLHAAQVVRAARRGSPCTSRRRRPGCRCGSSSSCPRWWCCCGRRCSPSLAPLSSCVASGMWLVGLASAPVRALRRCRCRCGRILQVVVVTTVWFIVTAVVQAGLRAVAGVALGRPGGHRDVRRRLALGGRAVVAGVAGAGAHRVGGRVREGHRCPSWRWTCGSSRSCPSRRRGWRCWAWPTAGG